MGVSIRTRKRAGKTAYYADVSGRRPDGSRFRKERGPFKTRDLAFRFGLELQENLMLGTYGKQAPKLDSFWKDTYRPWTDNNTKPSHAKAVEIAFRLHVLPLLETKRLDEIGPAEVEQLKAAMKKAKKMPHTINNVLGYLHRGLTLAVEHGLLERAPGVGLLPIEETEAEWLEPDEQFRWLAAARHWPDRYPLLMFLLETGLRIGEALGLRWRNVDTQRRVLRVLRTRVSVTGSFGTPKEGFSRDVHLSARAVAMLSERKNLRDLCFTTPEGSPLTHSMVKDWVSDAAKRAGLAKHVTNHSLRHTRTANMVMAGVDERTIMAELGWKTPDIVRRYAHLAPSHRRDAVEKVEAFLAAKKEKAEHDE